MGARDTIFARRARLPEGWAEDVRVEIVGDRIAAVTPGAAPEGVRVDVLLPAPANLHSHAFQRAMAGMTEYRATGRDSFWTWRELMYRFLDRLTPDHVEAIAALTQMEMLEAGFAAVGEFHYLHHRPGGLPYDAPGEMSARIFAAAAQTGIGLTHLPVLYSYGGAGKMPLKGGQQRFGCDLDRFLRLLEEVRTQARHLPADTRIGIAPHSLRAIAPEDLPPLLAACPQGPVHIHAAEQQREVDDIVAWLGARPVGWLLANAPVDARWCLIHATQMTGAETAALARSGAVAGLCPITEANLGDGIFNGAEFLAAGGRFGIGSDSNIRISLVEELRALEYSQRLRDRARNVLAGPGGSVGRTLYLGAARGGAQALGRPAGELGVGLLADLLAVDGEAPALLALEGDRLLDGLCFAAGGTVVTDLWAAGRHLVAGGRHIARDAIVRIYRSAMADLLDRI